MERLIYNDLDPMLGYPECLSDKEEKDKLKERLERLLVDGEEVLRELAPGYALTNKGRIITGKRKDMLSMAYSSIDIFVFVDAQRYGLADLLPNYNHKEVLKELKELGVPLKNYNYSK